MKYIFPDIDITLDRFIIDKKIEKNIVLSLTKTKNNITQSDIYYSKINKIYKNIQLWFNPIKYIRENISKHFFLLNTKKHVQLIKNNIPLIKQIHIYDTINILQYCYIFDKYQFLNNAKNVLHITDINNYDIENRPLHNFLQIYQYININRINKIKNYQIAVSNNPKDTCTKLKKASNFERVNNYLYFKNLKLKKKMDIIHTFMFLRLNKIENYEVSNTHINIISVWSTFINLNKNGHAIFYLTSFFENITQSLLLLLQISFKKVHIYHPGFYSYSWANWVICEEYLGISDNIIKQLEKIVYKFKSFKLESYQKYNTLIAPSIMKQIINQYKFQNPSYYLLGNELIKRVNYYIKPPKFNKTIFTDEILSYYKNYTSAVDINNQFVIEQSIKYIKKYIKYISNKENQLLLTNINNTSIYEYVFENIKFKRADIISDKFIFNKFVLPFKNCIVQYDSNSILNFNEDKYKLIIVNDENKLSIENYIQIWKNLKSKGYLIIIALIKWNIYKKNSLNCFINYIKDNKLGTIKESIFNIVINKK